MQAVASDSTARLDSSGYRRYRLQKFARILKALPGILLKERFKENDEWLWDIFEFFERQWRVLMLVQHFTRSASEWRLAGHHYPERDAKRVEVRADVNENSGKLLRTGEFRGPDKDPRR